MKVSFLTKKHGPKTWLLRSAKEVGIDALGDKHYDVIEYIQEAGSCRRTTVYAWHGKSGVVDLKEFCQLFPGKPSNMLPASAGVPKPTSCV